jgi:hypothetical protein
VKYAAEESTPGGAWSEIGWFSREKQADAVAEFERGITGRAGSFRLVNQAGAVVAERPEVSR